MCYWITNSGRKITVENFSEKDVCLHDIAHHLTSINRFSGALALGTHYSVANHSIRLTKYALDSGYRRLPKYLLLHDASEAYLGDVNGVLKRYLPDYKVIEKRFQNIIIEKYISDSPYWEEEKAEFDARILLDEAAELFHPKDFLHFKNQSKYDLLNIDIYPDGDLRETYYLFLYWCKKLGIQD